MTSTLIRKLYASWGSARTRNQVISDTTILYENCLIWVVLSFVVMVVNNSACYCCDSENTHQYRPYTLQHKVCVGLHFDQVYHSGRFLSLHPSCGAKAPPSDLWFCRTPTHHPCWEPWLHWGRTSALSVLYHQYNHLGNKQVNQSGREVTHEIHQYCPRVQNHGLG